MLVRRYICWGMVSRVLSKDSEIRTYPSPFMIVGRKVPKPKRAMEAEKKLADAM